ncbi:subtype B tannase [Rhodoferax sp.]|uniref:subtype B tannase n=1 Tax=Rhodoferax sp. TaxID=50421 RepID=UPI0025E15B02|nr:subtype B tannase [Rhodoferax sp.]
MSSQLSRRAALSCLAGTAVLMGTACSTARQPSAANTAADSLHLDPTRFEPQAVSVGGQSIAVRAYLGVLYISKPVDAAYQVMNIYVPEAYFQGAKVAGFDARTAPVFFPNQVGGYMPAKPGTAQAATQGPGAGKPSTIGTALLKGFVVASPGARGRTLKDAGGTYTGKAPAAIVDLKAAVRYLRWNAGVLPGDMEKIISSGTSAGGALSALLGASGNSPDYESYLQTIGAAPGRDDIFAVSAYCPITNLERADAAHEWLFNGVNDYRAIQVSMLDFNMVRKEVAGTLTPAQMQVSNALKPLFPAYVNSLQLRTPQGQVLALDAHGNGSFKDWVATYVQASAQGQLDAGKDLNQHSWLTVQGGKVRSLDLDAFVRYAGRMKLPPAFDALDASSGENNLFGTASTDNRHFTDFSVQHSTAGGAGRAEDKLVKMMNAMRYIGSQDARNAKRWRIRHGTIDRDTSLAIPVILATALQNQGYAVDFAMPWDQGHAGDYDLEQLFVWMTQVAKAN